MSTVNIDRCSYDGSIYLTINYMNEYGTSILMEFIIDHQLNVDKFISGDILLDGDDGTNGGVRWELRKTTSNTYTYTLGPMCSNSSRYVIHNIADSDPMIVSLIAGLKKMY